MVLAALQETRMELYMLQAVHHSVSLWKADWSHNTLQWSPLKTWAVRAAGRAIYCWEPMGWVSDCPLFKAPLLASQGGSSGTAPTVVLQVTQKGLGTGRCCAGGDWWYFTTHQTSCCEQGEGKQS